MDRNTQSDEAHEGAGIQIEQEQDGSKPNSQASQLARKRKRQYTEQETRDWERVVKRKLESETERMDAEENRYDASNRDLYALFNDLQGIKADFGLEISAPELVVVGGQSDGKCSYSEGSSSST